MMKFLTKKILFAVFLVFYSVVRADSNGPGTPCFPGDPCEPASSPIDMYVYILAIAAVVMIAYFAKKYKTQKI